MVRDYMGSVFQTYHLKNINRFVFRRVDVGTEIEYKTFKTEKEANNYLLEKWKNFCNFVGINVE